MILSLIIYKMRRLENRGHYPYLYWHDLSQPAFQTQQVSERDILRSASTHEILLLLPLSTRDMHSCLA